MELGYLKKRTGKKGSFTDLPFIIGGIFSVALVAILITSVVNKLDVQVQDNDLFPQNAKDASTNMKDDFPNVMDGGIVFIFFGMVLVSLVLASLVPVHPVFFVFYLFEYLVLVYLGAAIANSYQAVVELQIFAVEAAQYTLTIHFFRYFPYIIGVTGILLAIVMYKVKERITA